MTLARIQTRDALCDSIEQLLAMQLRWHSTKLICLVIYDDCCTRNLKLRQGEVCRNEQRILYLRKSVRYGIGATRMLRLPGWISAGSGYDIQHEDIGILIS